MSKAQAKLVCRKFDAEFKREAVKLSESPGYSVERAASGLGITSSLPVITAKSR